MMKLIRILEGLEHLAVSGPEAGVAARLGFLEWVVSGGDPTPQAARLALADPVAIKARSDAARAFVECLRQAAAPLPHPVRRCRRFRFVQ